MEELYEFDEDSLNEEEVELDEKKKKKSKGKKDACYHKVRARYDVWPSKRNIRQFYPKKKS